MYRNKISGTFPMATTTSALQSPVSNRRRRVRHKVQTPAYATFTESSTSMLDLHEIVDISEDGMAIQSHSALDPDRRISLCLDLAECKQPIYTTGQVVWWNDTGRAGIRFSELPADSLARLREWLFVNVMAGVANGEVDFSAPFASRNEPAPRPSYSDTLAAVTVVQRQVEALGNDLAAALQLIAERAQALVRSTGAAIALAETDPDFMVCRASSGPDAPPIGARLHIGSGFSGQCARGGIVLRCDDSETDTRVDAESCRAIGIRSILAAPIRAGEKSIGLMEAFSAQPNAFSEADEKVLQRLSETVLDAANRAARAENLPPLGSAPAERFAPPQGSVLFASVARDSDSQEPATNEKSMASIRLPRSYLILLTCALATIALALGFLSAPLIQSEGLPWIKAKLHPHTQMQTVLASTETQKPDILSVPAVEIASLDELRQMAERGDAAAENSLGLRYAQGDGVKLDEKEAVRWFLRAAQHGNVAAQSKLGSIYYSGRGVPKDLTQAYFWMVVARLSGDEASKTLSPGVRYELTREQITAIELQADQWLRQQRQRAKPAGQSQTAQASKM
jgi:TPR repeat protein